MEANRVTDRRPHRSMRLRRLDIMGDVMETPDGEAAP
jgi:hypothetical protein